ncbi:hypothetical protein [Ferruginibacter sp. HRS2-29]|uniref:hypothetical protein n=1 Tax=Ferruginibacter sp. HRS2-29 TaxID=2487334 RepID=UPI0020CDDCDD|nr:hypothetical protein [Ferruginibacter sp. HRS2-29]
MNGFVIIRLVYSCPICFFMKRILLTTCLYISIFASTAQSPQYSYSFDQNLNAAPSKDAFFTAKGFKENDLVKVEFFYKLNGRRLMTAHFTDSALNIMEGHFRSYYFNQRVETEGDYKKGLETGVWKKFDTSGRMTDSILYKEGVKFIYAKYEYTKSGMLRNYELTDSIKNTYTYKMYDSLRLKYDAFFTGTDGVLNITDSNGVTKSSPVHTRKMNEAEYPGGDRSWTNYIRQNLNAMVPVDNKAKNGIYQVIIRFKVKTDGELTDISAETNFGYGMEEEGLRIIRKAKKWTPANFFGITVEAYRRQPITFVISGD